ncbi:hypothetical protein D3C79_945440 [compost metagenome]
MQLFEGDIGDLRGNSQRLGLKQYFGTHHACHAATLEVRCDEHAITHQEQVTEYTFNHPSGLIEHQAFGMLGVLPFGTGEDLFKTIQVLEAGQ